MFRYELHMHTCEASACAHSSIHEMIRAYAAKGFSGAVVTNHFSLGNTCIDRTLPWEEFVRQYSRPYYEGQATARELGFDLLFGVEQGYGGGKEFLVYGFEPEFLLENPQLFDAGADQWSRAVHAVGGVFLYAHPFRSRRYIPDPRSMPDMSIADGVELYNLGNRSEDNAYALDIFGGMDMIKIAGSDSHIADFTDAWGVDFPARIQTGAALAAALKQRDFSLCISP